MPIRLIPCGPRTSETRLIRLGGMVGDAFGNPLVEIHGPFAEDFTKLKWRYRDHRDGETAEFSVCGLRAFVQDCDTPADYAAMRARYQSVAR